MNDIYSLYVDVYIYVYALFCGEPGASWSHVIICPICQSCQRRSEPKNFPCPLHNWGKLYALSIGRHFDCMNRTTIMQREEKSKRLLALVSWGQRLPSVISFKISLNFELTIDVIHGPSQSPLFFFFNCQLLLTCSLKGSVWFETGLNCSKIKL